MLEQVQPIFRDPKRFPEMADPLLNGNYSIKSLNQAVGIAAMCLEEEPSVRPYITDVVAALSFLEMTTKDESTIPKLPAPMPSLKEDDQCDKDDNVSDHSSEYSSLNHKDDHQEENDQNDSEHETAYDKESYSFDDPDHNDDDDAEEEEEEVGNDVEEEGDDFEKGDEEECNYKYSEDNNYCDHGFSEMHYKKSLKLQPENCNAESSDDESMYSSSTRTSTSSSIKEEQQL